MCWLKRVNSHHFFLTQKISFALFRSLFLSFVKRRERGSETLDRSSSEFHTMTSSFSQSSSFHSSGSSQSAFVEFFAHLSEEKINHLYTISPWATLAVLRALTPLAKQYIMRCVFLPLHSVIAHEMLASWTKRGVKVDLFSGDFSPGTFVYALWTGRSKYNGCTDKTTSLAPFKWHGVDVQVPVPLEAYLTHRYGNHYMKPQPWVWNVSSFKTGLCT